MSKLYTERDIIEQGDYYSRHTSAMTGEGLDRKSDIAAELAHRDIQIDQLQARFAELEARICRTCDGHGMIGGPSYSQPDEGGEPCPDCDAFIFRKQAEAVQASRQGVGGDSESIIGFHNALQRVKKIFSEYRQDWPKWGKRLDGTPALNDLPVRIAAAFSELYTHPASSDKWIKCSERMPTVNDADFDGYVWWARFNHVARTKQRIVVDGLEHLDDAFWMPTNLTLTQPQPPKQEQGHD